MPPLWADAVAADTRNAISMHTSFLRLIGPFLRSDSLRFSHGDAPIIGVCVTVSAKSPQPLHARDACGFCGAIDEAISELGEGIKGETLVDVTDALTGDRQLASGCTTASGAETLQRKACGARAPRLLQHPARLLGLGTGVGLKQVHA